MRIVVLALALMPTAAIAQDPAPPSPFFAKPWCPNAAPHHAKDRKVLKARKLGEEPAASEYLAVLRLDEKGCDRPVKIRENIGDGAEDQR